MVVGVEDVFFFKQKTAYAVLMRLVGSEMCIRGREYTHTHTQTHTIFRHTHTLTQTL